MMWSFWKSACWLLFCLLLYTEAFITNYFTPNDKARLKEVFDTAFESKDLASTHYAILGYKELNIPIAKQPERCKFLLDSIGSSATVDTYFYSTVAWKALASCSGTLPTASIIKVATETINNDASPIISLYQAVVTLKTLGQAIPQTAKLVKNLQALLKKDDSVSNLAYAFHIGSYLSKEEGLFAFDRIEDAIVQADEVDNKYLQFEGGLSITALVVSGVYKVSTALDKAPPVTGDQTVKFANYFLSRKSVQTPKGAYSLINILNIFVTNKFQVPVVVSLVGGGRVSREEPKLTVRLSDVLGSALSAGCQLTLESATRHPDALVIASKAKFQQSAQDKMVYSVGLLDSKPEAGVYQVKVSVLGGDSKLVGTVNIALTVRLMATAHLEQVRIGKADSDLSTQPRYESITFPGGKVAQPLELDLMQKLSLRFVIKDKATSKPLIVHQAFVLFTHQTTKQEVIFLTEQDTSAGSYKLDLDIGSKVSELSHLSGLYRVELLIGDVVLSNPFSWHLADVRLKLGEQPTQASQPDSHPVYQPKPEIKHLFREAEKRPPRVVSNLFTGLVLVPLLFLVILWIKIGINLKNFPISLSCIFFHVGLGSIFCLFGMFWLQLNMFETLKYLSAVGPITFLCGVKTLSKLASNKKH